MAHFKSISLPQIEETIEMDVCSALQYLFQNYNPQHWSEEFSDACTGMVDYTTEERIYGLHVAHFEGLGFSLTFSNTDTDETEGSIWKSMSNSKNKYFFIDYYSDSLASAATFIPPKEAWLYIQMFIENPKGMPYKINSKLDSVLVMKKEIPEHPMYGGPPLPEGMHNCYDINKKTGKLEPALK